MAGSIPRLRVRPRGQSKQGAEGCERRPGEPSDRPRQLRCDDGKEARKEIADDPHERDGEDEAEKALGR